jgi:hypothetical protein
MNSAGAFPLFHHGHVFELQAVNVRAAQAQLPRALEDAQAVLGVSFGRESLDDEARTEERASGEFAVVGVSSEGI